MTRDPVVEGVYTDPFNAFGTITLTMAPVSGRLTTHVLDTAAGLPGGGDPGDRAPRRRRWWPRRSPTPTAAPAPLLEGDAFTAGVYELTFAVGAHFAGGGLPRPRCRCASP